MRRRALLIGVVAAALAVSPAQAKRYGSLEFPQDEHQHVTGWDWWWGAAHIVTRSGHRYTLGYDFDSYGGGGGAAGGPVTLSAPHKGRTLTPVDGPPGWGRPAPTP